MPTNPSPHTPLVRCDNCGWHVTERCPEAQAPELARLREGLVQRFKDHPPSTWSTSLLAIVNTAIDLEFGEPPASPAPRFRPYVVKNGDRS